MVQLVCLSSILVLAITKGAFGAACSPIGHTYFRDSVANPGSYCLFRTCKIIPACNVCSPSQPASSYYSAWATWQPQGVPTCPPGWVYPPTTAPTPAPTPAPPPPTKGDVATGTGKGDGANGPAVGTCELKDESASNSVEELDDGAFNTEPSFKEDEEQDASAYTSSELNRNSCLSPDTDIPLATEEECEAAAAAAYNSEYSLHDPSWGLRPSGCYHDPASGLSPTSTQPQLLLTQKAKRKASRPLLPSLRRLLSARKHLAGVAEPTKTSRGATAAKARVCADKDRGAQLARTHVWPILPVPQYHGGEPMLVPVHVLRQLRPLPLPCSSKGSNTTMDASCVNCLVDKLTFVFE